MKIFQEVDKENKCDRGSQSRLPPPVTRYNQQTQQNLDQIKAGQKSEGSAVVIPNPQNSDGIKADKQSS